MARGIILENEEHIICNDESQATFSNSVSLMYCCDLNVIIEVGFDFGFPEFEPIMSVTTDVGSGEQVSCDLLAFSTPLTLCHVL